MDHTIPEKGQIRPGDITSFGISLVSRHGKAYEMAELLYFSTLVASKGLHKYIVSAYYDSNSCCCSFTFLPLFDQFGPAAEAIKQCALDSIGQFDWFDSILHGKPQGREFLNRHGFNRHLRVI